jgi:hypothetical protein
MTRWALRFLMVQGAGLVSALSLGAQTTPRSVSLGFGIDTTITDIGQIVRLTRDYLAHPDSSAARRLWSSADPLDRQLGDLTTNAYQGQAATILGILSDTPTDSVYIVKVLHAANERAKPFALQRLYVIRDVTAPSGFRFSSTLPRVARTWQRQTTGPMTFWYAPGMHPDSVKITRAVRFVDSVATMFRVPPPAHIHVIVANSLEEANRAVGYDYFMLASVPGGARGGAGGRTYNNIGLVQSGDPLQGEAYLHEIAHTLVFTRNPLCVEGIPTWLGGSRGRALPELSRNLAQFLASHPDMTLVWFLTNGPEGAEASYADYATKALVVDAIYQRSGIEGLRAFTKVEGSMNETLAMLPQWLGLSKNDPAALDHWWREEALRRSETR